jgi:hypothetical protein
MKWIMLPFLVRPPLSLLTVDESDQFLDDIDDMSRTAAAAQTRRSQSQPRANNGTVGRNHSPNGLQNMNGFPQDFDIADLNSLDLADSSNGGNSSVLHF